MTALAIPEYSSVLIIDPSVNCCGHLAKSQSEAIRTQFSVLAEASDLAGVPRYFAMSNVKDIQHDWLLYPCEKSRKRVFNFSTDTTPWSNIDLVEAIKDENRERLFVCGFWLDSTVSATALDAYVDGFDIHLISDLAPARKVSQGKAAVERLLQIGVVPISAQQLLYEWMTKTQNRAARKNLQNLIDENLQ